MLPDGLVLAAFLEREDVRDAFVSLQSPPIDELAAGREARLVLDPPRRADAAAPPRPRDRAVPRQCRHAAGKARRRRRRCHAARRCRAQPAGQADRITAYLDPRQFPPAPAQGAIGIEIRADDPRTADLVAPLDHGRPSTAIAAERALLGTLDGSCRTPIGAFTELNAISCRLTAEILSPDGREFYRDTLTGVPAEALRIGRRTRAPAARPRPVRSFAQVQRVATGAHARDPARTRRERNRSPARCAGHRRRCWPRCWCIRRSTTACPRPPALPPSPSPVPMRCVPCASAACSSATSNCRSIAVGDRTAAAAKALGFTEVDPCRRRLRRPGRTARPHAAHRGRSSTPAARELVGRPGQVAGALRSHGDHRRSLRHEPARDPAAHGGGRACG